MIDTLRTVPRKALTAGLAALLLAVPPAAQAEATLRHVRAAPSETAGGAWWGDAERGWFWYEDPLLEPQDKPEPRHASPVARRAPAKAPEIVELERLQKRLEDARKIAVMNPTEANVLRYLKLEGSVVRQASYFGDVAQRLGWAHPELNLSLEGRPVNARAIEVFERSQRSERAQSIAELARDHVVFFFFRGDCPYCHAYAPTLRAFEDQTGLKVVAVSLDGGTLPQFPRPRADNGISKTLQVTQVPATFIAQPFTGVITPVGFGVLSEGELMERVAVVTSPKSRAMVPETTKRISLQ